VIDVFYRAGGYGSASFWNMVQAVSTIFADP
jgi:hypothetical protein